MSRVKKITVLLLIVIFAFVFVFPRPSGYAVVGVDDAILIGILTTLVGTAAGLTFTASVNGVDADIENPLSNDQTQAIYSSFGSQALSYISTLGFNALSDWISSWDIDTDQIFQYDPVTGNLAADMPIAAQENIADFLQWVTENQLGGTSGTAVDFDTTAGNWGNGQFTVGSYTYYAIPYVFVPLAGGETRVGRTSQTDIYTFFYNIEGDASASYVGYYLNRSYAGGSVPIYYRSSSSASWSSFNTTSTGLGAGTFHYPVDSVGPNHLSKIQIAYDSSLPVQVVDPDFAIEEMKYTVVPDIGVEVLRYPDTGALAQEGVEGIPYVTDIPYTGTIPQEGTTAIPLTDALPDINTAVRTNTAVAEIDDGQSGTDTPSNVPIVGVGLDDVFPFCIPFDIAHFFEALAADPVAPHFEWEMVIPGVIDYTWEIDLQQFDTVAQILRTLELLAFCVGLAFWTRYLIKG